MYLFRPLITLDHPDDRAKLKFIRDNTIGAHKETYFDYTASGLAFEPIEKRLNEVLLNYANVHSKESNMAAQTNQSYQEAYQHLHRLLELEDRHVIIPTGYGATSAIKKFQELVGLYLPPATKKFLKINYQKYNLPLVVVGPYEHHSNEVSYREGLCQVKRIPTNSEGLIDMAYLERVLVKHQKRKIIGSFSIASNVTGLIAPYQQISELLRRYHATVCFDAVVSSPCFNIPAHLYDVMFLSPHKLLGGPGSCGLLVIDHKLIDVSLPPTFAGGGTVEYVNRIKHIYKNDIVERETAGTPPILQMIRSALVYQLRNEIGFDFIHRFKKRNLTYFYDQLKTIKGCHIYGECLHAQNIGIFSFNVDQMEPNQVCHILSKNHGLETRSGCSCAGPYGHDLLGLPDADQRPSKVGWVRVSIHYTHTKQNIDNLVNAIKNLKK